MPPKIMIATPCFGGLLHQDYILSVMRLMDYAAYTGGFTISLKFIGNDSLVPRARTTLASLFMDDAAATHMLFIDADISFQPEQVHRLLLADKEFAGALYPIKSMDWQGAEERLRAGEPFPQAAFRYVGTLCDEGEVEYDSAGFATASYVGGGFQLIRRSVFERLFAAYPQSHIRRTHTLFDDGYHSANLYALFDTFIDEQGAYLSEDYAFCKRFRDIGGKIWLDLKSRLTHTGPHDFIGDFESRFSTLAGEAAPLRTLKDAIADKSDE
jgi:hypothetical protein